MTDHEVQWSLAHRACADTTPGGLPCIGPPATDTTPHTHVWVHSTSAPDRKAG